MCLSPHKHPPVVGRAWWSLAQKQIKIKIQGSPSDNGLGQQWCEPGVRNRRCTVKGRQDGYLMWHKSSGSGRNYTWSRSPSSCEFPVKRNLLESPQKFPQTGGTYDSKRLILVTARGGRWGPDRAAKIPLWTKGFIPNYDECSLLAGYSWGLRHLPEGEVELPGTVHMQRLVDLRDNSLIPCLLSDNSEGRFIFRAHYTIHWGKFIAVQLLSNSASLTLFLCLPFSPAERNLTTMKMYLFPR